MNELRGTELVILLLDHTNLEILYSSCGVLLNFASDSEIEELEEFEDVVEKLFDVVDRTLRLRFLVSQVHSRKISIIIYHF